MRVLVTGATGFLGRAVVGALARHGHDVVAMVHTNQQPPPGASTTVSGDILDVQSLRAAVTDVDAVCHLAAVTRMRESREQPVRYWRLNTTGTVNLLDAIGTAGRAPTKFVHASTAAVYGAPEQQPITEDTPPQPMNPYGASKLAADHAAAGLAETGAIGAISLRAFAVAGAIDVPDTDVSRVIPKVLAVQRGIEPEMIVNGDGTALRDFVHVADMADAFVLALDGCEVGSWRVYNIGGGRGASVADVLRVTEEVTGRPVPARHMPPAHEPPVLLADTARIESELGWQAKNSDLRQIISDGWNALNRAYAAQE